MLASKKAPYTPVGSLGSSSESEKRIPSPTTWQKRSMLSGKVLRKIGMMASTSKPRAIDNDTGDNDNARAVEENLSTTHKKSARGDVPKVL